jgi:tetratricopeptide (TPR) repeat protein
VLGIRQSELGHREAALASAQEAVDLRRKLAQARLEAFLPDLAISLNNLSLRHSELGQREAALTLAEEALDAIWPFFLRLPAAFEGPTGVMLNTVREHFKALGQPPTPELLQRIGTFDAKRSGSPGPSALSAAGVPCPCGSGKPFPLCHGTADPA